MAKKDTNEGTNSSLRNPPSKKRKPTASGIAPKPKPKPKPPVKTQQQSQAQRQMVVVNVGSTRKAPAKKSTVSTSQSKTSVVPQQSYYRPSFSVYPIYQQAVNVPQPVAVSSVKPLRTSVETQTADILKSSTSTSTEPIGRFLGIEPRPLRFAVETQTADIPTSSMSTSTEPVGRVLRIQPKPKKFTIETQTDAMSSPAISNIQEELPTAIAEPYKVAEEEIESEDESGRYIGSYKFTTGASGNFSQEVGVKEYRRRYGEDPPPYLKYYSSGSSHRGLGTFLNNDREFNYGKPPATIQEYDAWMRNFARQKAKK